MYKLLTSSSGQPVDRNTVCDCSTSNFNNLSLISPNDDGLERSMTIRSVITEVNSPIISLTGTTGLSEIISSGMGFQFFIIMEPVEFM